MTSPEPLTDNDIRQARTIARLRQQMVIDPDSGCWHWCGQISNSGYGRIVLSDPQGCRYTDSVHRVSYQLHTGTISQGMVVVHTCGNSLCINPEHLQLKAESGLK